MAYRKCKTNTPDCFNCPYPDCIANEHDIGFQESTRRAREAEEKKATIIKLYKRGMKIEDLMQRYGMSFTYIYNVVKAV